MGQLLGAAYCPWLNPGYAGRALVDIEASAPLGAATLAVGVEDAVNT